MPGGILIIILTGLIAFALINTLKQKYPFIDSKLLKQLFFYHVLLSFVYYIYVLFNRSDSKAYYSDVFVKDDWFSFFGTSTTFIKFLAFPFVRYLSFSYEAAMAIFAFFGYLGFVYAYIFFKESIRFKHHLFGYDLFTLIFFLPNLHFWSGSLGKGSVILLGIGLFFFGLNNVRARWVALLIGAFIIYHVRPHIMLVILVSSAIGFMFSPRGKGISIAIKIVFVAAAGAAFFYIYKDVLTMVGINEEEFLTQGLDLTHRASELAKATSGVDITSYSLPLQVFTFLYRPLFFDAPGLLGWIVSVENVFYLLITFKLLNLKGIRFLITSSFIVKSAFLSFITVTVALAQIAGNLGLAMRQKSQVMILLMFVIISFMDQQKFQRWKILQRRKARNEKRTREKQVMGSP